MTRFYNSKNRHGKYKNHDQSLVLHNALGLLFQALCLLRLKVTDLVFKVIKK